ncbi:MAG: ABC transporter ATP-binding protein [Acidobacteria bacterium]|nr:ABC transporter ATP-binding protein [Acidobacteriota bacterium]
MCVVPSLRSPLAVCAPFYDGARRLCLVTLARWTASWLRPYRGRVGLILILSAGEIGLTALAPWALKLIVDSVLGGEPLPQQLAALLPGLAATGTVTLLVVFAASGLLLQVAAEVVRLTHTQLEVEMGQRVVHDLRTRLLDHLQALPLGHHLKHRTADAVYRLDADTYCINDLATGGLFPIALAGLHLAVMFGILIAIDPTLALLSLGVAPFLYLSLRYHATTLVERAEQVKTQESGLVERAYETLRSIAAVKAFARERHELRRYADAGRETMRARVRLTWQESLFSLAVTAITLAGTAVILVVGGLHVLDGTLTVGTLLVVIAYLAAVYDPVSAIAHTVGTLQEAVVSARRVRDLFALRPEVPEAPGAVDASAVSGAICFDGVGFSYDGDRQVLDDVTFAAHPGDLVAIVGPTGAGKTTLVHLIPRLFDPTAGRVLIDERNVADYRLRSLRERIALAPQDPVLFAGTIGANIRYGRLGASDADVEAAARSAQIHEFICSLPSGYETPVDEAGATLSGGERQRLGIARALVKQAPILILDEPASSLDAIAEAALFNAIRKGRKGRTTLVIAHRLATVRDATRILVLDGGRVAAAGTHDHLVATSPLYRRMWERFSSPGGLRSGLATGAPAR